MKNILIISSLFFGVGSLTTFAFSHTYRVNHAPHEQGSYEVKYFKRKHNSTRPVIAGNFYDFKSKKRLAQFAIFVIDNQSIRANEQGYYKQEVEEGKHNIIGRNIFYENILINNFKVSKCDSITIDFFLIGQGTVN